MGWLEFVVTIIGTPAIQSLLIMGLGALAAKIGLSWVGQERWTAIVKIATDIVSDLLKKGGGDWRTVASQAMNQLKVEIEQNPGLKNLTPEESGRIAPLILSLAQRKNGVNGPAKELSK